LVANLSEEKKIAVVHGELPALSNKVATPVRLPGILRMHEHVPNLGEGPRSIVSKLVLGGEAAQIV
jgi:hypothetical protein